VVEHGNSVSGRDASIRGVNLMDLKEGPAPTRQMLLEAPIVRIEELQVLFAREERKR
jgi:hypothetical protein